MMEVQSFTAHDLFNWLTNKEDFLLLDVRNDVEFGRFKVEGPYPFEMVNVPYMEFVEMEDESVAKVPRGNKVRIVCAKEGSSKFVGEILVQHGFEDVAHMKVGIKAWGNLLEPVLVGAGDGYELYQFRRPGKASCSYGLISGKEMMVFDPAKNIPFYRDFARDKGCAIVKTFETHRQADYISGSDLLRRTADVEIVAPDDDFKVAKFPYTSARHGETHRLNGGPNVDVIHTPGHTPGSTTYLIDDQYMITGDTVFIKSIGRPDLGGNQRAGQDRVARGAARRGGAAGPPPHIHRGHAGPPHPGRRPRRGAKPSCYARRSGQGGSGLPRRPELCFTRGARPRAEPCLP